MASRRARSIAQDVAAEYESENADASAADEYASESNAEYYDSQADSDLGASDANDYISDTAEDEGENDYESEMIDAESEEEELEGESQSEEVLEASSHSHNKSRPHAQHLASRTSKSGSRGNNSSRGAKSATSTLKAVRARSLNENARASKSTVANDYAELNIALERLTLLDTSNDYQEDVKHGDFRPYLLEDLASFDLDVPQFGLVGTFQDHASATDLARELSEYGVNAVAALPGTVNSPHDAVRYVVASSKLTKRDQQLIEQADEAFIPVIRWLEFKQWLKQHDVLLGASTAAALDTIERNHSNLSSARSHSAHSSSSAKGVHASRSVGKSNASARSRASHSRATAHHNVDDVDEDALSDLQVGKTQFGITGAYPGISRDELVAFLAEYDVPLVKGTQFDALIESPSQHGDRVKLEHARAIGAPVLSIAQFEQWLDEHDIPLPSTTSTRAHRASPTSTSAHSRSKHAKSTPATKSRASETSSAGKVKRTRSAFNYYTKEHYAHVKEELEAESGEKVSLTDVNAALRDDWAQLTAKERAPYEKLSREDHDRFLHEKSRVNNK